MAGLAAITKVSQWFGTDTVEAVEKWTLDAVQQFMSPEAAQEVAVPILEAMFRSGTTELGIIGFIVALWAGSKAVMEVVNSIYLVGSSSNQYGYFMRRLYGLAFLFCGLVVMALVAPVAVIGPDRLGEWLNLSPSVIWIVVLVFGLAIGLGVIIALYRTATLMVEGWTAVIPGALVATVTSALAIFGLSIYVQRMYTSSPFLGVLTTPIALMVCVYVLSLITIGGAVFNYVLEKSSDIDHLLTKPFQNLIAQVQDQPIEKEDSGTGT